MSMLSPILPCSVCQGSGVNPDALEEATLCDDWDGDDTCPACNGSGMADTPALERE